jgi:hypothetical protein
MEFGAVWMQWWVNMQPLWCKGGSLIRILPEDADWEPILCGGPNGLSLVVMALSWWICSTIEDREFSTELQKAFDDVNWVLSKLVANLENRRKCSCEADNKEEPKLKK